VLLARETQLMGNWMLAKDVPRVKLPSGKEATPLDALKFCYNLSETDLEVLTLLMDGNKLDVDTIASKLGLSKATVNRALNKLVSLGFVERERHKRSGAGRPKYIYYVKRPEEILDKISKSGELDETEYRMVLEEKI